MGRVCPDRSGYSFHVRDRPGFIKQNSYSPQSLQSPQRIRVKINELTHHIIGAAIAVHRVLGPGLLESTYEACLTLELTNRALMFERQKILPVIYRGIKIDTGYRVDLIVNRTVIVELKSIERFERIHTAQLLTYLKLTGCPVGLLINFNVRVLTDGIRRVVLGTPASSL